MTGNVIADLVEPLNDLFGTSACTLVERVPDEAGNAVTLAVCVSSSASEGEAQGDANMVVQIVRADGTKCERFVFLRCSFVFLCLLYVPCPLSSHCGGCRCWKYSAAVTGGVCPRCADVLAAL